MPVEDYVLNPLITAHQKLIETVKLQVHVVTPRLSSYRTLQVCKCKKIEKPKQ